MMKQEAETRGVSQIAKRWLWDFVKFAALLTFTVLFSISAYLIGEARGIPIEIVDFDIIEGGASGSMFLLVLSCSFLMVIVFNAFEFTQQFLEDNPDGWTIRASKRINFIAVLCRTKTGYVGALLARHALKITMSVLIISVSLQINNAIAWSVETENVFILKILSLLIVMVNLIVVVVNFAFVSLVTRRILDDIEQDAAAE